MDDLPNLAIEDDNLPFGELDREMMLERVLVRESECRGLRAWGGRLVADVSGDSFGAGDLVVRASRMGIEDRFSVL